MRYKISAIVLFAAILLFWGCSFFKKDVAKAGPYPEWVKSGILYQISLQHYPHGESFRILETNLTRIKAQGFDILWVTGVVLIGEQGRHDLEGSGKLSESQDAVPDFKTVNPEAGTAEEFKKLVSRAHELGFRIIIDWASLNRNDLAQPDYDRKEVQKAMIDAMKFLVQEYDIDGFSCAGAGRVPAGLWERTRTELQKLKPVFMVAGDEDTPALFRMAFDANYSVKMNQLIASIVSGKMKADDILKLQSRIDSGLSPRSFRINFSGKDEAKAVQGAETDGSANTEKACALLTYMLPGMPLVYQGQGEGVIQGSEFLSKDTISHTDSTMIRFYKTLNELRHRNQSLWSPPDGGKLVPLANNTPDKIVSFLRSSGNSRVLVLANMSSDTITTRIITDIADGKYINVFNQNKIDFNPDNHSSYFEPWGYLVLEGE